MRPGALADIQQSLRLRSPISCACPHCVRIVSDQLNIGEHHRSPWYTRLRLIIEETPREEWHEVSTHEHVDQS